MFAALPLLQIKINTVSVYNSVYNGTYLRFLYYNSILKAHCRETNNLTRHSVFRTIKRALHIIQASNKWTKCRFFIRNKHFNLLL